MDPQSAAKLIGWQYFPNKYKNKLRYEYSDSGIMVYLGLKAGFDLKKYGFGNHNTWHCFDWDMNKMWQAGKQLDIENAWLFLSTPSLHALESELVETKQTLEIGTYFPYANFKEAANSGYKSYLELKSQLADRMIDLVVKHHIPDLKDHIEIKIVGSPTTNEDFCNAPYGNAYGSAMLAGRTLTRLNANTPFDNFFWCNASSGVPGIYGTVGTGMDLYTQLTGDEFYFDKLSPTDEEFIADLASQ